MTDMQNNDDADMPGDTDIAMQEMMGFKNFTGTKRTSEAKEKSQSKQTYSHGSGANAQPLAQRTSQSVGGPGFGTATQSLSQFIPTSLPPQIKATSDQNNMPSPSHGDMHSPNSNTVSVPDFQNQGSSHTSAAAGRLSKYGRGQDYVHPTTGFTLTAAQLQEYATGRKETQLNPESGKAEEVTVYFQPNFIEDDPWSEITDSIAAGSSNATQRHGRTQNDRRRY